MSQTPTQEATPTWVEHPLFSQPPRPVVFSVSHITYFSSDYANSE